jgi:hypothetical protein
VGFKPQGSLHERATAAKNILGPHAQTDGTLRWPRPGDQELEALLAIVESLFTFPDLIDPSIIDLDYPKEDKP